MTHGESTAGLTARPRHGSLSAVLPPVLPSIPPLSVFKASTTVSQQPGLCEALCWVPSTQLWTSCGPRPETMPEEAATLV